MDQSARVTRDGGRNARRLWALGFLVLPAALLAGLIAPDLVKLAPADEHQLAGEGAPVFQVPPLRKSPLLVPRDFSAGFTPDLFDLQDLFSRSPYAPSDVRLSRVVAFPRHSGELIAVDEVDEHTKEIVFKDVLAAAIAQTSELPGIEPFLPLANPLPRGNGVRYDDFPGPSNGAAELTTPVPEPGSLLLLAGALLALSGIRRRAV